MTKCDFCNIGTPHECPYSYIQRKPYCDKAIERMIEMLIKAGGKINV